MWENISNLTSLLDPTTTTKPSAAPPFSGGGAINFHDFFNIKDPFTSDHPRAHHSASANNLDRFLQSPNYQNTPRGFPEKPSSTKKRPPENNDDDSASDRRKKRLIKNRESADRSRARRQAYTNELEQKNDDLKKENAKLKKQLQKVGILAEASLAQQQKGINSTKGASLRRTLTAPF